MTLTDDELRVLAKLLAARCSALCCDAASDRQPDPGP